MRIKSRMPTGVVGLICCGVLLAACGGSSTNVSDSSFLSKCERQNGATTSVCRCLQQKLVAQGYGGLNYNLKSTAAKVERVAINDIEACSHQGGGSGTGTT